MYEHKSHIFGSLHSYVFCYILHLSQQYQKQNYYCFAHHSHGYCGYRADDEQEEEEEQEEEDFVAEAAVVADAGGGFVGIVDDVVGVVGFAVLVVVVVVVDADVAVV